MCAMQFSSVFLTSPHQFSVGIIGHGKPVVGVSPQIIDVEPGAEGEVLQGPPQPRLVPQIALVRVEAVFLELDHRDSARQMLCGGEECEKNRLIHVSCLIVRKKLFDELVVERVKKKHGMPHTSVNGVSVMHATVGLRSISECPRI